MGTGMRDERRVRRGEGRGTRDAGGRPRRGERGGGEARERGLSAGAENKLKYRVTHLVWHIEGEAQLKKRGMFYSVVNRLLGFGLA
jgi:hypothetical protein